MSAKPAPGVRVPIRLLDMKRALDFLGDEAGVAAMLPLLAQSLRSDVPEISRRLDAGDAQGANKLLHPIKGFVPIFCVDYVVDRVTEVEVFSKTASAEQVRPRFDELKPLLQRLTQEIDEHLAASA